MVHGHMLLQSYVNMYGNKPNIAYCNVVFTTVYVVINGYQI